MVRLMRRRRAAEVAGVRFCDACARVSTAAQRAREHHDRLRTGVYAAAVLPR